MLFQQLLIDLFKFLAPFLRNAELAKQTHLLYKVTRNDILWGHSISDFASHPSFESHVTQLSSRLNPNSPAYDVNFFVCYHEVEGTKKNLNHHGRCLNWEKKQVLILTIFQGTLRVLLVLLHDFPEFLCDYHFSFCDVIPPNCIQMRNLILSAFPRNMRLPDPFTPNLKVWLLSL